MAHYGLTDDHLLAMPIKRFWLLSDTIDRLNADKDVRAMQVAVSALSGDSYRAGAERLEKVIGVVIDRDITITFEKDTKGIQELKSMLM